MRVLKPDGKLIATMAAAREEDWFHELSKGWCYSEATLREIFDLSSDCPSNYDRYDELFESLRNCNELCDNLADSYFQSGNNGMPWGIWDPKYQPVGVVKIKPFE
jgi:ubiquinone/menaquinone biosynthesis C-methylase UbiE